MHVQTKGGGAHRERETEQERGLSVFHQSYSLEYEMQIDKQNINENYINVNLADLRRGPMTRVNRFGRGGERGVA